MFDRSAIIGSALSFGMAGLYAVSSPDEVTEKNHVEPVQQELVGDREFEPTFEIQEISLDETTGPIGRYQWASVADWRQY